MVSEKLEKALNKQINAEFWSAYLYLSMSAHFSNKGLPGVAHWFRIQFKEEQAHAVKIMDYLISKGNRVELEPIAEVTTSWKSPLAAYEHTLKHEGDVTALINNLVALARSENDFATENMLQWFVSEQVEEVETVHGLIDNLKLIGDNGFGLYTIDKELGQRVYVPINGAEE
jgi:ferritin